MIEKGCAPEPVKLFTGVISVEENSFHRALSAMERHFGTADFVSDGMPFDVTDYYRDEMGAGLLRHFCSFERLISPGKIVGVKLETEAIEKEFTEGANRTVNLDPGYLDYHKVVLPSLKFGGQKIYLSEGIWADMTLIYEKGGFKSFDWGFPDFKDGRYDNILLEIRRRYKEQMKTRRREEF